MEKQFVTYEIAKKLKELGFNEPCLAFYSITSRSFIMGKGLDLGAFHKNSEGSLIAAPLWQQAIDWLRDEKLVYVEVKLLTWMDSFIGVIENADSTNKTNKYHSYEPSREAAILKALELLNN